MTPRLIVIHSAQCDDTDALDALKLAGGSDNGPYHALVESARRRALAVIVRPWTTPGRHCTGYNSCSVGVAFFDDCRKRAPTPAALELAAEIIGPIMVRFGIPLSGVVTHRALRPGKTDCPGDKYDHAALLALLPQLA